MSVGISRLSNATEKFSNLAGKIYAAKSAMLNSVEPETKKEEAPFTFSRPLRKNVRYRDENVSLHDNVIQDFCAAPIKKAATDYDEPVLFEIETEVRTEFLNTHIKDKIMSRWELLGEEGPVDDFADEMPMEDLTEALRETMPLMLAFQAATDYVELEYMVIPDPKTGESVAPVVTVEPSQDGKAGSIYLNGKLAASVAGAQSLQAADVKLVQAKI
ncbi:MAG: hypothetical protein JKX71_06970 [Amylibacter sp.]|nr:hypothetical protein [Amylibacter sp.]